MTDLSEEALDKLVTQLGAIRFTAMRANHAVLGPRPFEAANNALHQAMEAIIPLRVQNAGVDEWKARAEKAEADLAAMTALKRSYAEMKDVAEAGRDALMAQFIAQSMTPDEARDLVADLNRAAAGKTMTLPATDGGEGEPA